MNKKEQANYDRFILSLKRDGMSEHTITSYSYTIREYFNSYKTISRDNLLLYRSQMMETFKPKTVNARVQGLNKFLDFTDRSSMKMRSIKIQQKNFLDNVISQADYLYLVNCLRRDDKGKTWYFIVRCLCATGARISELIRFKAEHIFEGYFDIYSKGGKVRRMYIPETLRAEMMDWLAANDFHSGFLFRDSKGKTIDARMVRHKLKRFARLYGIPESVMYPHSFRHRYAKNFLEAYNDVVLLADLMGHEKVETTRIYLRRSASEQRAIVDQYITW